jgi:hypothetical protein
MQLTGTWTFNQTWTNADGFKHPPDPPFTATFHPDGTVTLVPDFPGGFAMVWYTGDQAGQQQIILAGGGIVGLILAAYCGTMASDNTKMSGTASGRTPHLFHYIPVTGTWSATLNT